MRTVHRVVRALRCLARAVYHHERQYITVKRLDVAGAIAPATSPGIECSMVDSVEALRAVGAAIPAGFRDSPAALETRVATGCVLCLAWRPRADGAGKDVVGYEIAERGIFSALGRRIVVANDVVFSHHAEVVPAYRGQRIHGQMFATRDRYFRRRGARLVCGVCLPRNRASLHALRRDGAVIVDIVERLSLFRGRFVWHTPVKRIEQALGAGAAPERARRPSTARKFRLLTVR